MLLTSITQAARNALAAWLAVQLEDPGVVVEPRWFEVDRKLPARAISIIDAGPRKIEWTDPEQLIVTVNVIPATVDVVWGLGYVTQAIQLDVWAQSDVELDDLMARLDIALNAGARALGISNPDPVGVGLQLTMSDGWEPAIADYTFDEPSTEQTADAANQSEWHAMYRGVANLRLTQTASSARLARFHLNQRLGTHAPDTTAATDLATVIDADVIPFHPLAPEHAPSLAYVRPNYSVVGGAGTWIATAGDNLTRATAAPAAIRGAPSFNLADLDYLQNATSIGTWLGAGDFFVVTVVDHLDVVASPFDSGTIWTSYDSSVGLFSFDNFDGTTGVGAWCWDTLVGYRASPIVFVSTATLAATRFVVQFKKVGGFLWLKVGGAAWVKGDSMGPVVAGFGPSTQLLVGGDPFAGDGITGTVAALGFYKVAQSDAFADAVVTWAATAVL